MEELEEEELTDAEADALVGSEGQEADGTPILSGGDSKLANEEEMTVETSGQTIVVKRKRVINKMVFTSIGIHYETLFQLRLLRNKLGMEKMGFDSMLNIIATNLLEQMESQERAKEIKSTLQDQAVEQFSKKE